MADPHGAISRRDARPRHDRSSRPMRA